MTVSRHRRTAEQRPRCMRGPDGLYRVPGTKGSFRKLRGKRVEVVAGSAYQTTGGLTRKDLRLSDAKISASQRPKGTMFSKKLKVVSRRKQQRPTGGRYVSTGVRFSP